ncbi:MAG TPA: hypothetical protein VHG70_16075 [Nocardioidaceae bacterium]|nr:hypothetical protein [Nocardioidaceae bacterium]
MPDLRRLASLAKHALVFELNIYKSLLRWVARRPSVPEGTEPVGYAQNATPVIWLWIFASAMELPLVHVLIPWDTVRIVGLVIGIWGLLWMLGMLAGLRTYPHLVGEKVLRVRNGAMHDIHVPWAAIDSIGYQDRALDSSVWTLQPRETAGGTDLQVATSGRVNVHAKLRRPMWVQTRKGDMEIAEISFWTDNPREFVARVRPLLAAKRRSA